MHLAGTAALAPSGHTLPAIAALAPSGQTLSAIAALAPSGHTLSAIAALAPSGHTLSAINHGCVRLVHNMQERMKAFTCCEACLPNLIDIHYLRIYTSHTSANAKTLSFAAHDTLGHCVKQNLYHRGTG